MYERKVFTEVEEYIMHPEYEFLANDIALVKLRRPLKFNETVQPACLPATSLLVDTYDGILKVSSIFNLSVTQTLGALNLGTLIFELLT